MLLLIIVLSSFDYCVLFVGLVCTFLLMCALHGMNKSPHRIQVILVSIQCWCIDYPWVTDRMRYTDPWVVSVNGPDITGALALGTLFGNDVSRIRDYPRRSILTLVMPKIVPPIDATRMNASDSFRSSPVRAQTASVPYAPEPFALKR